MGKRDGTVTTNKHRASVRERVLALIDGGMTVEAVGRKMRGLIDRTTIQLWVKKHREDV